MAQAMLPTANAAAQLNKITREQLGLMMGDVEPKVSSIFSQIEEDDESVTGSWGRATLDSFGRPHKIGYGAFDDRT